MVRPPHSEPNSFRVNDMRIVFPLLTILLALVATVSAQAAEPVEPAKRVESAKTVELFAAMQDGTVEVKFIAKSDHDARVLITNKTNNDIEVKLPEAFVALPVVAQFGGQGGGGGGLGGGGLGGGGGTQGAGGGFGGGGGGVGGGGIGGGGGAFSIPAEQVGKLNVAILCLDHGKKDPSSSKPYKIHPVDAYVDKPEVVELLKAFGRGELEHHSAQAAVWHMQNEMPWQELSAKLTGTVRSISRQPYFSRAHLEAAYAYVGEAQRRGAMAPKEPTASETYHTGPESE